MIALLALAFALQPQAVQDASCARAVQDVPAQSLPVNLRKPIERRYDFTKQSTCIDTGEDRRRVLLLRLGEISGPAAIEITSEAARESVLPPEVRVLDRDGSEIAHQTFAEFRQRGTSYTGTVFVDGDRASGGLMMISADAASLGRTSFLIAGNRFVVVFATPLVIGGFTNGSESRQEHAFAERGKIRVRVIDGGARTLSEK